MTWRSLLYVPVTQRRFVEKALTVGADAIQLDLEDSIAPGEKDEARRLLPEVVDRLAAAGADVVVRINRPWRLAVRDLEAAVRPGVCALALPKVPSAEHVQACAEIVAELEVEAGLAPGSVRFIAMIETAAALFRAREIAAADPRVLGLVLGTEDFATDVGIEPDADLLTGPNQTVVIAARAAGVLPLGLVGTLAEYRDEAAFGDIVARSRRLGYVGASAIHPRQVPLLNAGFTPTTDEFEQASRLVAAYQDAHARGVGAIQFEGRMVDEPVAQRARAVVSQFNRYRETGSSGLP